MTGLFLGANSGRRREGVGMVDRSTQKRRRKTTPRWFLRPRLFLANLRNIYTSEHRRSVTQNGGGKEGVARGLDDPPRVGAGGRNKAERGGGQRSRSGSSPKSKKIRKSETRNSKFNP